MLEKIPEVIRLRERPDQKRYTKLIPELTEVGMRRFQCSCQTKDERCHRAQKLDNVRGQERMGKDPDNYQV